MRYLNLWKTPISDLYPLSEMPLEHLDLSQCRSVKDLTPLKRTALTWLNLDGCTAITNLGPLAGLPLAELRIRGAHGITDLSPLGEIRTLVTLECDVELYDETTAVFDRAIDHGDLKAAIREGERIVTAFDDAPCFNTFVKAIRTRLDAVRAQVSATP